MAKAQTITQLANPSLCTGCGTCAGVCPSKAVTMQLSDDIILPNVDATKCVNCGLCLKVCPGYKLNFDELNTNTFNKTTKNEFGNYIRCYVGQSTNDKIRHFSSSGGAVTELLIFALEQGIIDGALVTRMKEGSAKEPEPFIARTKEEIIEASKSKYCPVPLNAALRQLISQKGKFAVVGLPCHLQGIRKAERVVGQLKGKIVLHLGLMCSHTVSFHGTDFILRNMHIKPDSVSKLSYRGYGWPGVMRIECKNGSCFNVPYVGGWNAYWPVFSTFLYTPLRCLECPDHSSELADISFGDAWLPEYKSDRQGKSILISRTEASENLLSLAVSKGILDLSTISEEKVKASQAPPLRFKKEDIGWRMQFLALMGVPVPELSPSLHRSYSLGCLGRTFYCYFNMRISQKKVARKILVHVPLPVFRLYYGLYKLLSIT